MKALFLMVNKINSFWYNNNLRFLNFHINNIFMYILLEVTREDEPKPERNSLHVIVAFPNGAERIVLV